MAWRSCAVLLARSGHDALRSSARGDRCPHSLQQRCGFKKAVKKPEPKKVEQLVPHQAEATSPRAFGRLFRPLVFTVGFTGCSFGSAAIWQYESLKSRVESYFHEIRADWLEKLRPQKRGEVRKEINKWWNSLSEGERTATGIIAANAIVFCCWRVPALRRSMMKYFTSNPASKTRCSPMLLSTFSHFNFFHIAANMFVLWSFSSSAVSMLGREQFLAMYLSAGVVSSFFSYVLKTATGRVGPSLGASGAIMAVVAAVCTKMPETKMAFILLPMVVFQGSNVLKALIAIDTAGVVMGWTLFDHAAHLGGAFFGIWYILFGHEQIWKNREPFVKRWHDLRTGGGGANGGGGAA